MRNWLRYKRFYHYYMWHAARYEFFELLCTILGEADVPELLEQEVMHERTDAWVADESLMKARAKRLSGYMG